MSERILFAVVAVLGGVLVGTAGGGLTRRLLHRERRGRQLGVVAAPAAAFVFWVVLAIGIAIGISFLAPDTLRPLAVQVLTYLPRVLVAGLLVIVGYAAAAATGMLLSGGLARATGRTRREAALSLRIAIMTTVTLLALGQLGVDTTILTIAVAALLFGGATAMALLIGLGGRELAGEVAAGRYLRRLVRPGDRIDAGEITGRIAALHPATTEVDTDTSGTMHVPHTQLLSAAIRVQHGQPQRPGKPSAEQEATEMTDGHPAG